MEADMEVFGHGKTSKEKDLLDPMLILRPSMPMFASKIDGLRFNPTLAIGAGGDSDLVYEMFPQVQYDVTERMTVRLGYRTVGYRFKGSHNEDNELNFRLAGLVLGAGLKFW
jgi:hypothetical protein